MPSMTDIDEILKKDVTLKTMPIEPKLLESYMIKIEALLTNKEKPMEQSDQEALLGIRQELKLQCLQFEAF